MKRLALAVALLLALPMVASALVGPEPGSADFKIIFKELSGGPFYDQMEFDTAQGWDFGDREAYRCTFVEFVVDGVVTHRIEFEQAFDYPEPPGFQINDKGGEEHGDGDNPPRPADSDPCGTDEGGGIARNRWVPSGEDHFPHYDHHNTTAAVTLFLDGEPIQTLDLNRDECARGYWTPGDEPGEVVLWWDADFPENNGHHALDCNGGGAEPIAAARGFIIPQVSGAGYCVADELDGDVCEGVEIPPTPVVLGSGTSELTCGDGSVPAILQPDPLQVECP